MRWSLRRRRPEPVRDLVDDGSLITLIRATDPSVGDAAALRAGGPAADRPVLVRHLFQLLEPGAEPALREVLAQDGWELTQVRGDRAVATATRTLTVLGASQARARMTGLEMRLPVRYDGWEAAAPAPAGLEGPGPG